MSSWSEKENSFEPPGDGRNVAPLKPIENDHEGGTRWGENVPDTLTRTGGISNFDETGWEVTFEIIQ